jgi:hypothetical protein
MLSHAAETTVSPGPSNVSRRVALAVRPSVGVVVLPVLALALAMFWDWGRPGLYMDSINPEYLVRWILHRDDGTRLMMPGNMLFGRLPVFTGTVYHGSTQLYFALPFFAALGINLASWRVVQFAAAAIIVVLVGRLARSSAGGRWLGVAAGLFAAGGLVADPGFVLALRTQAYSCMFPVALLLAALAILRVGGDTEPSQRRRLLAGMLYGLAAFSYFIFILFGPAMLWILWRSVHRRQLAPRLRAYGTWILGVIIGYLPFVVGVLLIAHSLGGLSQALHYMAHMSDSLHVGPRQGGVTHRLTATARATALTVNGDWVSLTMVHKYAGPVGVLRATTGAVTIAIGVSLSLITRSNPRCRQALQSVFALLASFWLGSFVFGDRLQGHHFAALIPLWYLAVALSLALVADRLRGLASSRSATWRLSATVAVTAVGCSVAGLGIAGQTTLHAELAGTGGAGLYSQAITALGVHLESEGNGAAVITPDWGYALPVEFLAGDNVTVLSVQATPRTVRSQACRRGAVAVVNNYPSSLDLLAIASKSGATLGPVELWEQPDGEPVFQVAWFKRAQPC